MHTYEKCTTYVHTVVVGRYQLKISEMATILQGCLSHRSLECPLSKEAVTVVSLASAELFASVQKVLKHSSLPGRQHYVFSLSHMAALFQVSML